MKQKHLVILVAVLVCGLLLTLIANSRRGGSVDVKSSSVIGERVFPNFPSKEVTAIAIEGSDGEVHLEKKGDDWSVVERDGYPADFDKVVKLLQLGFDLSPIDNILVGDRYDRVGLADPEDEEADAEDKPMVLSFAKGEGKDAGTLWVGGAYEKEEQSQFGSFNSVVGRYVRKPDASDVYLVGSAFDEADTDPANWLDDTFVKVRKIKTLERIPADDKESGWKLTRDEDRADYILVDLKEVEELDQSTVSSMKSAFSTPRFADVMVGDDVEEPSALVFKVDTFDGFKYVFTFNEKNEANEYLMTIQVDADLPKERPAVEGESDEDKATNDAAFTADLEKLKVKLAEEKALEGHIYKVRSSVIDSINKPRADLMKQDEPATTGAPGGIPGMPGGQGLPIDPQQLGPMFQQGGNGAVIPAPGSTPIPPPAEPDTAPEGEGDAEDSAAAKPAEGDAEAEGDGDAAAAEPEAEAPAPEEN